MKEEIKFLLKRAKSFFRDAKYDYENRDYDLAMFHIEQAIQLLIKAKLLDLKGSYERTHSIRRLLSELSDLIESNRIREFIRENKKILRDLERAYISSRYYYEEFFPDEVENAMKIYRELRDILWRE
ncbi:DNA-binding protein [Candidatus Geothermarchaeota archaeon]|nr:MAG: DNA-binding protein [Candidatus Geothermarchaeota archaeon]